MPRLAASYKVDSAAQDQTTLITESFDPLDGEIIVVKAQSQHGDGGTFPTPTGGSLTYTLQQSDSSPSQDRVALWTAAVSGSPGSMAVSVGSPGAVNNWHSIVVERWQWARLADSPASVLTTGTASAPSTTLITVAADSVVSWLNSDWNAVDGAGRAYNTTSAVPVETGYLFISGNATFYWAYQPAARAGSQTFGLTAPGGQNWSLVGVEILDGGPFAAPDNPALLIQQGLWRPWMGTDTLVAEGPSASGATSGEQRTDGSATVVKGAIGAATGTSRVSGLSTGAKGATGPSSGQQRAVGTTAGSKQTAGPVAGQQHTSGITAGIKQATGIATGQTRSSGAAVRGTPPTGAAFGQQRVSGLSTGSKSVPATTATGQQHTSGATAGIHHATATTATGQIRTAGISSAAKATTGATSGRQRTAGLTTSLTTPPPRWIESGGGIGWTEGAGGSGAALEGTSGGIAVMEGGGSAGGQIESGSGSPAGIEGGGGV